MCRSRTGRFRLQQPPSSSGAPSRVVLTAMSAARRFSAHRRWRVAEEKQEQEQLRRQEVRTGAGGN